MSMRDPSKYNEVQVFTNSESSNRTFTLFEGGPYYLIPFIPDAQKGKESQHGRMMEVKLGREYRHWQGTYCIWYMKDQGTFYVLRQGKKEKEGEKVVLQYDSVRELSKTHANPGIDAWMHELRAELAKL